MVAARSAAMGFNRLVDARYDALNPRTAMRELPRGAMTAREAALFVASRRSVVRLRRVAARPAVLRAVAGRAGDRVLVLAGQALHDLHAAVSRPGDGGGAGRRLARGRRPGRLGAVAARRWRSAPGSAASTCSTPARISTFDRAHGLRSIPVRFGVGAVAGDLARDARRHGRLPGGARRRCADLGWLYLAGVAGVALLLVYEQSLVRERRSVAGQARVRPERLRRHPLSRRPPRRPSMSAESPRDVPSRSRSPARAARSTRRGRWRRCSSAAATSSWSSPTTAGGCCATSWANGRRSTSLPTTSPATLRRRRARTARSRCTATGISARRSPAAARAARRW